MHTGAVMTHAVLGINKDLSLRLGASRRMKHQAFHRDLPSRRIAGILRQNTFHYLHSEPPPSSLSWTACYKRIILLIVFPMVITCLPGTLVVDNAPLCRRKLGIKIMLAYTVQRISYPIHIK